MLTHTQFYDVDTIFASVSNEGLLILIKEQLTELAYKTFASSSKNSTRNKEKKKKGMAIAKCFVLHANTIIYPRPRICTKKHTFL